MSLQACADLVARGDPDRFAAAMAAPVSARRVLFPLYAFNLEIARAPWVTNEPLIAEMRLQWWADALEEIASGGPVRKHEVTEPLAQILRPDEVPLLLRNVEARRRDAQRLPMASLKELRGYLSDTGGAMMWAATRLLDPDHDWGPADPGPEGSSQTSELMRAHGMGGLLGLANYLLAVPEFLARGVNPLPEMTEREFSSILTEFLTLTEPGYYLRAGRPRRAQRIAELSAWRARGILRRALRDPAAVPEGRLEEAPVMRQLSLMWQARGL